MNKIKTTLEKALLAGGVLVEKAFYQPKKIEYKSRANLVTETDKAAERKILDVILNIFPNHTILAEETESRNPKFTSNTFINPNPKSAKWIIDPIDGTTNFAHGLALVSVSIGFEENGVLKLGGVWNPILKEMFFAEKGKGAYLNGKRISVSKTPKLESSLLVTGFPYDKSRYTHNTIMNVMKEFLLASHGIRRLGSAAIDLCYVACGRFDGYWESKLQPWDQAAGALIAEEAGAKLSNFKGKRYSIYEQETLATNGKIHSEMLKVLKKLWK